KNQKLMKTHSLLLGCLILFLVSCSPKDKIIEVYTCGVRGDTTSSVLSYEGVYWKSLTLNTIATPTPPDKKFGAIDLTMEGSDMYILGSLNLFTDNAQKTVYWKNGVINYLDRGASHSAATDLHVEHGNIYVLVNDNLANLINMGYYKNGTYVAVSATQGVGKYGSQIFVFKDTVRIAGYQYTGNFENTRPRLWVDGDEIILSTPAIRDGQATAVFVSEDGTTHVSGAITPDAALLISTPVYWRNGVYTALPLSSGYEAGFASSIFVEDGNVYIGGVQYDSGYNAVLTYWKNGVPYIIDNGVAGYSTVSKIAALNGNVYCIGFRDIRYSAALWVNGSRVDLGSSGYQTYVYGLFVKYKD
ncbi:MAG TPA: hypothetical protein PLS10_10835, partial [Chitinophagales bacterium]|nr:hypothetical protein [Chitinophagales bacterium]